MLKKLLVEFNGKKYPPLYTPKNDTLINLFRITDDEQRQLRTILSTDIAKERDRERDEQWRREQGAMEREAYLGRAEERKNTALLLRQEGLTIRAIAEKMGVSTRCRWMAISGPDLKSTQSPSVLLMA